MKVLFIGGSGNISSEVSKYAISKGIDLYHLNRGNRPTLTGIKNLIGDIHDVESMKKVLEGHEWDVVVNWIAFKPNDVLQDIELFKGKTNQYIFISSASAYQKPPKFPIITEDTPLENPFWDYSRDKIACEDVLVSAFQELDFPSYDHHILTIQSFRLPLEDGKNTQLLTESKKDFPLLYKVTAPHYGQ